MKKRQTKKQITLEEVGESVAYIVKHMATKDDLENLATKDELNELGRRITSLEKGQTQILEKLEPLSRAHDKDSETIIDHSKRILNIEKHVNIRR